jgi:hypothetical protein
VQPSKPLSDEPSSETGFEALFYDEKTDTFSAVIEAVSLKGAATETADTKFHSIIYDLRMRPDGQKYDVVVRTVPPRARVCVSALLACCKQRLHVV